MNKLKYLVLILLPFLLYGCTSNNQTTPTPTPTQIQEEVVLYWWNIFDQEEDVKPLIDKYTAANPNVKILFISKDPNGDFDKYVTQIDEAIVDKEQTPDIFPIHNTWAGKYKALTIKAPTSLIDEAYFDDYYSVVKTDFYDKGAIALPQSMDAMAIIYNVDLLEAQGYTNVSAQWSDFKNMAQKLTIVDPNNSQNLLQAGFSAGFYDNVQFRFEMLNLLLKVNGVNMTNLERTQATFYNWGEKDNTDSAVKYYEELGRIAWSNNMKKDIAAFLEGDLAMYAAPSWRLIDIINYNKQYNLNLKIGVAQVPQLSNYSTYWPTYWGYTVSATSPKSVEAWKFIKFLNEKENLELYNKTVLANGRPIGIIYPRINMNSDLAQDKLLGPYVTSLNKAENWYMYDGLKMKNAFEKFFAEKSNQRDINSLQSSATTILNGN